MTIFELLLILGTVYITYKTYVYFRRKLLINKYPLLFDPLQWKVKDSAWYMSHTTLEINVYVDRKDDEYHFCYDSERFLKYQFSTLERRIILGFLTELRNKKIQRIKERERQDLLKKGSTFKIRCTLQGDTKEVKTISDFLERDQPIEVLEENIENIYKKETT